MPMVNSENISKRLIAKLHVMVAFSGSKEIYFFSKQQRGIVEYQDLRLHDGKQQQKKIIHLKPETFEQLKVNMNFKKPQALESHLVGCDGVDYELTIYHEAGDRVYEWWCDVPRGWESVVEATNTLLDTAGVYDRAEINSDDIF